LVTGRRSFTADTPAAILIKHINDPLPRPSDFVEDLRAEVEQVIFKALAKNPENRYVDMATFAKVLEKLARREPVPAEDRAEIELPTSKPWFSSWLIGLLIGLVLLVIAGVIFLPRWLGDEDTPAAEPSQPPAPSQTPAPNRTPAPTTTPTKTILPPAVLLDYLDNPKIVQFDDFEEPGARLW
jgi:hypothetical protein